jgi:Taurine catabolism dioxygenase TauD, TfdA family
MNRESEDRHGQSGVRGHRQSGAHADGLFDVRVEPTAASLAFTGLPTGPHTDNPYRDPPPTDQLLHCLVTAAAGGESWLLAGSSARSRQPAVTGCQVVRIARRRATGRLNYCGGQSREPERGRRPRP